MIREEKCYVGTCDNCGETFEHYHEGWTMFADAKREAYVDAVCRYLSEINRLKGENENLRKALMNLVEDVKRKPNDTRYATAIGIATEALKTTQ